MVGTGIFYLSCERKVIEAGGKNDVVNKVLSNVLEEEVSYDVDLHEAIEDQEL